MKFDRNFDTFVGFGTKATHSKYNWHNEFWRIAPLNAITGKISVNLIENWLD